MNKNFIIIAVIVLAALGGYFLLRTPAAPSVPARENSSVSPTSGKVTPQPENESGQSQTEESANVIIYSDNGYAPNSITIKAGESVTYKNQSSRAMWPASAMHPTHRVYPTTGGCLGSTFDACRGVLAGGSWTFTFDIAGTWKYHDHLNPSASNSGTVITVIVE